MNIRAKIKVIRLGLTVGIKATDKMLKIIDMVEKETKEIASDIAKLKEITPEDEDEPEAK